VQAHSTNKDHVSGSPGTWARCSIEGAGASILLAPGLIWNQLSQTHLDLYHRLLPITTVVRALAIDVAILWLLATLALRLLDAIMARRVDRRSLWLLLWALWFGLLAARLIGGLIVAQFLSWQQLSAGRAFALTAAVLLLIWLVAPRAYPPAIRGLRFVVLLLGFSMFWVLPMLTIAGFAHQPHDQAEFHKPIPAASSPHRRIVWLLFDEMSYDQVFDHRWPGLALPNFDQLRAQSVTFSDMQPNGYFTEQIIPSLFLGKPIVDTRSTTAGTLLYQTARHAPWTAFDGSATLFGDAKRQGWTTGISGDYNPYCRILRDQLDSCWMRLIVFGDHLSRDKSTWRNVTAPLQAAAARTLHRPFEPAPPQAEIFSGMISSAQHLITNDNIDFAFVHLYLPHPPGFYNRKTGRVAMGGSYIDNLALADRTLGDLLQALSQTPSMDQTTLIVSSDHSWRVGIWRHGFGWTKEDEQASGHGHFDPRPTLIVRFPNETEPVGITRPIPLLAMHNMIESMMAGQLTNPQQLQAWASKQ
jgi:hypothetical protein